MLNKDRQVVLEHLLRKARQQVFDKPGRSKAIRWLKRQLQPYWTEHAAEMEHQRGQRMLRLWA